MAAIADRAEFYWSAWPPTRYRVTILGTLVIAAALNNEKDLADRFLRELENTSVPYTGVGYVKPAKDNSLARAYLVLGRFDQALAYLGPSPALGFVRAFVDVTSPFAYRGDTLASISEIPRLMMLGKAQLETGKLQDARQTIDGLLSMPRLKDVGALHWLAHYERARLAERENKSDEAIKHYREAIEIIEQQRSSINTEACKIGFVGDKQAVYARLVAVLVEHGRVAEAFDYVERSKSRALVDMLASKKDFAVRQADEQQIHTMLAQLETLETEARVQATDLLPDTSGQKRSLDSQIKERLQASAPELASLVTVTTATAQEIQPQIQAGENLIEYYYYGEDLYAFVVSSQTLKAVKLDGSNLVAEVEQFRKALMDVQSQQYLPLSQRLYRKLIQPIESFLNSRNLVLVPHGALHYLPFNALHGGSDYLVDRYSVRLLPSASVISYLKKRAIDRNEEALIFGNPDLGDPQYDLRYAQEEAVTIAKEFSGAKVLLRAEATETIFKKTGGRFGYLHFATHGQFKSDSPMNSGLYLARDAENDGVLTVGELYSLRLSADLVTLSACETGLGKINSGDDIVGLSRGFLYAGARSIVGSLWSVEDSSTAQLMVSFYKNLKTMSKLEALRQAQLQLIRGEARSDLLARRGIGGVGKLGEVPEPNSQSPISIPASIPTSHPYFWAPFILVGDGK